MKILFVHGHVFLRLYDIAMKLLDALCSVVVFDREVQLVIKPNDCLPYFYVYVLWNVLTFMKLQSRNPKNKFCHFLLKKIPFIEAYKFTLKLVVL